MRKTRSSLSISSIIASRRASRYRMVLMGFLARERPDVGRRLQDGRVRLWALFGEPDGGRNLDLDVVLDLLDARLDEAHREQLGSCDDDGVTLLVLFEFGLSSILCRIAHRVAAEAVRAHFDERGKRFLPRALDGLGDAVLYGKHVLGEETVSVDPVAEGLHRYVLDRHGSRERRAHRILVVLADEDDGKLSQSGEGDPP